MILVELDICIYVHEKLKPNLKNLKKENKGPQNLLLSYFPTNLVLAMHFECVEQFLGYSVLPIKTGKQSEGFELSKLQ